MTMRGVALVDAVMEQRRAAGEKLKPMDPDVLANESLGDRPLTPALRRWLEADGDFFTLDVAASFEEMVMGTYFDWGETFLPLAKILTAPCVLFDGWGADSRRFIYIGETDAHGELPVFTLDVDDEPFICINGPVDVWLAQQAGFLPDEKYYGYVPPDYEVFRDEHAKLNFNGHTMVEAWDFGDL